MTRKDHLERLVREHGRAAHCEIPDDDLPRWALMERDAGPADNGGPWWDLGDDPIELCKASLNQEYPEDWPIERVYDLDTGKAFDVGLDPHLIPLDRPA